MRAWKRLRNRLLRMKLSINLRSHSSPNPNPQLSSMSTVPGSSSDLSQEDQIHNETPFPAGVVDKQDGHSTSHNTESKLVADPCGDRGDSPRKPPLIMHAGSESELAAEFEHKCTTGQKGNPSPSPGALPQNTPISDFLKAEAEAEAGDVLPKVFPPGYVPPKGYAMVCQLCGVVNCRTPGLSRPVMLSCCFCKENGTHYSLDCPVTKFHGPPMPEGYSCFYWKPAI